MTIRVTLTPGWHNGERMMRQFPKLFPIAIKMALVQEAHFIRNKMVTSLSSGWPGHSPLTLIIRRARGSSGGKMLVESASMRNAITVVPIAGGVFVGVKRGRGTGRGGKDAVDIAKIHHTGARATQVMTDRQRRFLFAMLKKAGRPPNPKNPGGGGKAMSIYIPPRPFITRALTRHALPAMLRPRLRRRVAKNMRGLIGT